MIMLLYTVPLLCELALRGQHLLKKTNQTVTFQQLWTKKNPQKRDVGLNGSHKHKTGTISTPTQLKDHSRRFVFSPHQIV